MRDSFIFYKSFYEAIKELPDKERLAVYDAISGYQFEELGGPTEGLQKAIFILIRPQLDANNRRYQNGQKGGRPPKENQPITKLKPSRNQTKTKPKANKNDNVNVNENVNGYSTKFEEAWKAYPTKPGMSKHEGWKSWQKANQPEGDLLAAVFQYASDMAKPNAPFACHFATFFNQHRYEGYLTEMNMLQQGSASLNEMYADLGDVEKLICDCLTPPVYKSWLSNAEVDIHEGYIDILFPTRFAVDYFRTHYRDKVEMFIGKKITCDFKTEAA